MIGISQVTGAIKNSLSNSFRSPATVISAIIMLCAMVRRPGLSCALSSSNVIQNMAKHGMPTGPLPDGSPNLMNMMVTDIICETFRAIKEDANIQIALPPGALDIQVAGGNGGGPVECVGTNVKPGSGVGLMQ